MFALTRLNWLIRDVEDDWLADLFLRRQADALNLNVSCGISNDTATVVDNNNEFTLVKSGMKTHNCGFRAEQLLSHQGGLLCGSISGVTHFGRLVEGCAGIYSENNQRKNRYNKLPYVQSISLFLKGFAFTFWGGCWSRRRCRRDCRCWIGSRCGCWRRSGCMFWSALVMLVVTSTLSQVKSPYAHANVDPNRTTQFLVATLAGLQVPFVCSETHELGEELVASYLYQVHLYDWLESNDHGRFLADNDL